jgi:aspartyl-tRNA(Asn)/glutamyl-tRNA(Gln) amidotransferase subunit C
MTQDPELLDHLARLSRLTLSAQDRAHFGADLNNMLGLIDQLQALPLDGIAPLSHPLDVALSLRDDVVTEPDRGDALLGLSAESRGGYFLVPKVID